MVEQTNNEQKPSVEGEAHNDKGGFERGTTKPEEEETFETNWDLEVEKFDDMGLKEDILRGIYAYGYKEPTPIQRKGILPVIQGKDTIAQA
jgi:translation initiation factor 4A